MENTSEQIKKLASLIKDIKMAMLTTVDDDGTLRSRPMATQQVEFEGDLWFFTGGSSPKTDEIAHNAQVNVSFSDTGHNTYVSVSGKAEVVHDAAKAKELWSPAYRAWFPEGLDDPNLALLKITAEKAEYWDSPSSKVVQILGFLKAVTTGKQYDGGEDVKVELATR